MKNSRIFCWILPNDYSPCMNIGENPSINTKSPEFHTFCRFVVLLSHQCNQQLRTSWLHYLLNLIIPLVWVINLLKKTKKKTCTSTTTLCQYGKTNEIRLSVDELQKEKTSSLKSDVLINLSNVCMSLPQTYTCDSMMPSRRGLGHLWQWSTWKVQSAANWL